MREPYGDLSAASTANAVGTLDVMEGVQTLSVGVQSVATTDEVCQSVNRRREYENADALIHSGIESGETPIWRIRQYRELKLSGGPE